MMKAYAEPKLTEQHDYEPDAMNDIYFPV